MKYIYSIILSLLLTISYGQDQTTIMEKVEAAKIALITERLNLTPEQAEKFWPVYREFSQKQVELRQEFRQLRTSHDPKTASDAENKRMLEKGMQIKQRQLDLEKNYSERMQKVISTRQVMSLKKAEDDFRQMLIQRVKEQKSQQDQLRQKRMMNENNMQRKRNN